MKFRGNFGVLSENFAQNEGFLRFHHIPTASKPEAEISKKEEKLRIFVH